jgi:hypothetical protein
MRKVVREIWDKQNQRHKENNNRRWHDGHVQLHNISCDTNLIKIGVYGTSGHYYQMQMKEGNPLTCWCQDNKKIPNVCEHMEFILTHILHKDVPLDVYLVKHMDMLQFEDLQ